MNKKGHFIFYVSYQLPKNQAWKHKSNWLLILQSHLCIRTPVSSGFKSTKASLNLSLGSFWRSEQRPPVKRGHFCYSPWLTCVDRFDCSSFKTKVYIYMWSYNCNLIILDKTVIDGVAGLSGSQGQRWNCP